MSDLNLEITNPQNNILSIENSLTDTVTNVDINFDNQINIDIVNTEKILPSDFPDTYPFTSVIGDVPYTRVSGLNNAVSGLLPVKNITNGGYINVLSNTGNYTISVTGLQPSGNYSVSGHSHSISDISNFGSGVSGFIPSGIGLYDTSIFSLGTISGTNSINCGQDRQIQTLTLNGVATTLNKGTGWPPTNSINRDVTLNITTNTNTSVVWNIINDWYRQPDSPLPSGKHIVLLRGIGSGIVEGHYIGSKST
jgi:hypothetical protein